MRLTTKTQACVTRDDGEHRTRYITDFVNIDNLVDETESFNLTVHWYRKVVRTVISEGWYPRLLSDGTKIL